MRKLSIGFGFAPFDVVTRTDFRLVLAKNSCVFYGSEK
jgi:hypothetical protein